MKKALSVLAAVAMLVPAVSVRADDHLVSPADVSGALSATLEARSRDVACLDRVLSRPEAAHAAAVVNADLTRIRGALSSLSDGELRDLAARAEALDANPVAGLDPDIRQLLIIFLIIAIVILVFQAID